MVCDNCKKREANVFLKGLINEKEFSYRLCIHCAKKFGLKVDLDNIQSDEPLELPDLFSKLHELTPDLFEELPFYFEEKSAIKTVKPSFSVSDFFASLGDFLPAAPKIKQKECSQCGMSLDELRSIGKVGCDNCYIVFKDELNPLIKRIHGNDKYLGKPYMSYVELQKKPPSKNIQEEIKKLKKKLEEAVKREDFETAAQIRDQIKSLQKSIE